MAKIAYQKFEDRSPAYLGALALLVALVLVGLGAAWVMEHEGHVVTGMTNRVVWGMPHVFAVFLIVAASGALNLASVASVFGRDEYKPYARFSALLAMALLIGGLAVLVLDLGRPDRLIVAMTKYNFRSIFAWNVFLYVGFLAIVAAYLFAMMDRGMARRPAIGKAVGWIAFVWRLVLTTGTGSIFGWLVAREAYDAAVMAPLFIAASFLYGLALTILLLAALGRFSGRSVLTDDMTARFRGLLAIFATATAYFTALHHLTNFYAAEHREILRFLLVDGGAHVGVFWIGQVVLGTVLPLVLLIVPTTIDATSRLIAASALFAFGGLAQIYSVIIGGQSFPLRLFPGMDVSSGFHDGLAAAYRPSLPEILLGLGGLALALSIVGFGVRLFPFLPKPAR